MTTAPTIHVVNKSTSAEVSQKLPTLIAILQAAITNFCHDWGVLMWHAKGETDGRDVGIQMVIFDDSDQQGALGYHDVTPDGRPYAKIFVNPILSHGGSVISPTDPNTVLVCMCHEAFELIVDQPCVIWADLPVSQFRQVAYEVGDPVENTPLSISVGGVTYCISDYVLPAWFDAANASGPYDRAGVLTKPFQMAQGGYTIVRTGTQKITDVWGSVSMLEFGDESYYRENFQWKLDAKHAPAARTGRRLASH